MSDNYPDGFVQELLPTDLVTPPTRDVLQGRLTPSAQPETRKRFLGEAEFQTLGAVCARLFPQAADKAGIDLATAQDGRLAGGKGNGWRYDTMPPDDQAAQLGLLGLEQSAQVIYGQKFTALTGAQQDELLLRVQQGGVEGEAWQSVPPQRFFEELLADLVEIYYSHPLAQDEIGYAGMADGHGWTHVGLNEHEPWEPRVGETTASFATRLPVVGASAPIIEPGAAAASPPPNLDPVDVVVIGTGAGGAPLIMRLTQAGFSVVALEAGKHLNPADFPTDERAQSGLFWNDERLSAGSDPVFFGNNNSGIGVGGSTLHYTAYTPRAQPDDFAIYSEFGVGADWPLRYEDLEAYYDEVEHFLGVSGPSPYPWGPARRTNYPLPPLPLNGAAQLMQRGCEALGIQTSPAANAALSAPYYQPGVGWRRACTNRGFCQAGCSTGAKASMDVTYIAAAMAAGLDLRPECFVTKIETDKTGKVTGVIYTQNGREVRQSCRAVFLCAGAVESPRLLLLNGLANGSGQVGRNFLAHPGLQLWAQFDDDVRPYKGIPGGLISEDMHRPKDADFAGGYLLQSIGVMPVTYASQLAHGPGYWGQKLDSHMRGYNHVAGINILGEGLPYAGNFLELSDEKDARGLPKPRVYHTAGENEIRMTAHADRIMRAIFDHAGAHDVWAFQRFAHTIGTCRMGADPANSVVNADGRCHDISNLYVMDNSVLPSSLSVNPALTQMALSLRTADQFIARAKQGEA